MIFLSTPGSFIAALESMYTLNEQGMIVVAVGLIGVFLILLLFFVTIILIQKSVGAFENMKKNAEQKRLNKQKKHSV